MVDEGGRAVAWNDAAGRLLGAVSAPWGRPLADLLSDAGAAGGPAIVATLLDSPAREFEVLLAGDPDDPGEGRHLHLRATRWITDDGARWIGVLAEDRTQRRRDEEELTQLASFPELDPSPILELDEAGEVTYMNAAGEEMHARGLLDPILTRLGELLVRTPSDRGARLVREVQSGDTWFELGIHAIPEFHLTRIYAHEITERKLAEAAAEAARRDLERRVDERTRDLAEANQSLEHEVATRRAAAAEAREASRVKSTFLANMSHELRTPLNAIVGYAELIRDESQDGDIAAIDGDIDRILGAARHLLGLINNVLDISKIEAGKMEVFIERVDLDELLQEVADTVRGLVTDRGNQLVCTCPNGHLGVIRSDALKLRQVLINLLGNAAKFTERGTVTLRARRDGDAVEIAILDTGIGIDEETQRRLFIPFVQADGSATRSRGGTGLGLAISAEYCRLLGGALTLTSRPGEGSTFTVTLPIAGPPAA